MPSFIDEVAPWPEEDFSTFGPTDIAPRSRIQKIVGRALGRNWIRIPHVTHHDEVDVTQAEVRRAAWNAEHPDRKITPVIPVVNRLRKFGFPNRQ